LATGAVAAEVGAAPVAGLEVEETAAVEVILVFQIERSLE
jgi:hypothetical protein